MTEQELLQVIENAAREGATSLDLSGKQLSQLPPEIGQLTNLQSLNLSDNQLSESLLNLQSLNLSSNQLSELPPEIGQLAKLQSLDFSFNHLSELPSEIGQLANLQSLNLSSNQLSELPLEIGQLSSLQSLDFSFNHLSELPSEIGQLSSLQSLDLHNNQLDVLPAEIGDLANLQSLDLRNNQLSELPPEIRDLTNLESLNLNNNQLSELPLEIGDLANLESLDLNDNQLRKLPAEIEQLTKLKSLDLRGNQLCQLPAKIGQLVNLKFLNLSDNKLNELPPEIGQLANLESLDLSGNKLSELPAEISQLANLAKPLDLRDNQLSKLPAEIGQLTNLPSLDLRNNQLSELPTEIGQLANLKFLDLSGNQLSKLPPEFGLLANLESLDLSGNQLSKLPAEIGQLANLKSFYLNNNQLSELSAAIGQLTGLLSFRVSNNQLSQLPAEIGQLVWLQSLDLGSNSLGKLPAEILQLVQLQSLDLRNNQLSQLPAEIVRLTCLQRLDLRDNPLNQLPTKIQHYLDKPGQAATEILRYYRRLLEQQTDRLYEAKLLIVGEAGAGKTSLAKKIESADYQLDTAEQSTEGIDIIQWQFPLKEGEAFRVNIWDFGGQEIYYATHQFFLTQRSLYILVADSRKEDTDFFYWLNAVELLSNNSPILIVKNEKQERRREIDERQLRGEFLNLKQVLATNLATNRGLAEIKREIQHYISGLPHVGTELPKAWVKVRQALDADGRYHITLQQYLALCKEHGLIRREDALRLSSYLHDLGVCLHFQEDALLRRTVILKPTWATDAVYQVLDNPQIAQNLGKFDQNDLAAIWQEEQYAAMLQELVQLMMKFTLCYAPPGNSLIPYNVPIYIAPQFLSADRPYYEWDDRENLLLHYRYEFMPKGIIARFIVAMHQWIEDQSYVWKTGVVLLYKNGARAEVIELYHRREIRVRVWGHHRRDLLAVVHHELDKIHNSYSTLVPCNCKSCNGSQTPEFYPLQLLHRFQEDGEERIQCRVSYAMVLVQGLIDDINRSSRYSSETMTDSNKYQFHNPKTVVINEGKGQVIVEQYQAADEPMLKQAVDEMVQLLQRLQEQYPTAKVSRAAAIVKAEVDEIRTSKPAKWRLLKQQLLSPERWLQGGKAALLAALEHFAEESVFGKAGVAFLERFSEEENEKGEG